MAALASGCQNERIVARKGLVLGVISACGVLFVGGPIDAAPAGRPPPRVIVRFDVALLGLANVDPQGGGGISIPVGGTGAGLDAAGGVELGAEVRLSRWIAIDVGVGAYRPDLEVGRDRSPDAGTDLRSAPVGLRTVKVGLMVTPPTWRTDRVLAAVGVRASHAAISGVPAELGIAVDQSDTGVGGEIRADFLLSKNRRWGVGVALSFENLDPRFVDVETGAKDSLQVSEMFLRVGVRGAW